MGAQRARAMKSGSGAFDVDDFVSKLISFMGGAPVPAQLDDDDDDEIVQEVDDDLPLDWDKIGRKAMGKSRRVPYLNFMFVNLLYTLLYLMF